MCNLRKAIWSAPGLRRGIIGPIAFNSQMRLAIVQRPWRVVPRRKTDHGCSVASGSVNGCSAPAGCLALGMKSKAASQRHRPMYRFHIIYSAPSRANLVPCDVLSARMGGLMWHSGGQLGAPPTRPASLIAPSGIRRGCARPRNSKGAHPVRSCDAPWPSNGHGAPRRKQSSMEPPLTLIIWARPQFRLFQPGIRTI